MPLVKYSKKELLRDKLITPAWYRVRIDEVGEWTPSADGKSQNMVVDGTVLFNGDNGSPEFADYPIGGMGTWSFNTKALGYSLGLVKAVAPQFGLNPDDINSESTFEFKTFEGHEIDVFIENDQYQGRMKNKVNHKYREPRADVSIASV